MYLKRIELKGFKSFADRTELEFVPGITAVVGPNGSGKSNISDSIRWVLGEQSAKSLRGGKMEDVIFAGSDTRKPVNYGEVSITLDNSSQRLPLDYSEVTVTRRILRSGESEYYINKQACRLKDITELFMDTGIGKEAYSIIGQGRIEEILSTKSEERRGIFEEASGIVKYKSRKKQAEKKLEETEQNLLRIADLIAELEGQIEPLEEQAEKAKRYKALKEELKKNEIALYVHQIDQVHASWNETKRKLEELERERIALSTIVSQHDAALEKDRLKIRQLEEQLEKEQQTLLTVSGESEKCDGQIEVLKERKRNLEASRKQSADKLASLAERIAARQQEHAALQKRLQEVDEQLKALQQSLQDEEARLLGVEGASGTAREEDLRAEMLEVLSASAQHRNEVRYLEQQEEALARRRSKLEADIAQSQDGYKEAMQKRDRLQEQLAEASAAIEELRRKFLQMSEEVEVAQQRLEEWSRRARELQQRMDALTSRRDTMQEMKDDYDGFAQGVRTVLKAREQSALSGVHGAVAELIHVPAEYEVAIEIALGGALQNIVMDDEASARAAIQYLKQKQAGRATFLPLDVMRGRSIPEEDLRQLRSLAGYIGIAVDLISFEERYRNIAANLLGNVVIAETLEHANQLARRTKYRYRVVTLAGDVVNPGGSMTGGSLQKKSNSILGRQRVIEELNQEIAGIAGQLDKANVEAEYERGQIRKMQAELEKLRAAGEQARLREQDHRSHIQQVEHQIQNLESVLRVSEQEMLSLQGEQQALANRKAEVQEQLVKLSEAEAALNERIREAEEYRKSQESAKSELQSQLTEIKVRIASVTQDRAAMRQHAARTAEEIAALSGERTETEQELARLEQELAHTDDEIKRLTVLHAQLLEQRQQCAERIEYMRADRARKQEELVGKESETKEQRVKLREVEEALHQLEVRVNRLDVELDNLLKNLAEDYEISYELAKERYPVPEDVLGMQATVRDLKRQISQLGDVNLGAIEEFERVSERYNFLTSQKNDLVEAKQTLYEVIRDIEKEMAERFTTTFEQIRSHFRKVFVKLFGGGRADLVLSEPDRILETGIDIIAQPPGKKLQNLQLLSGGEKALTAIALLFAIIHVRPVPFCVLDEVEAALDEANVSRFAQYLREFSNQTQFIVVTHRKGTMEEADVLYGVTMEDDGVSKLVSVRLEEGEPVSA
jgi:chromosome segregation protein